MTARECTVGPNPPCFCPSLRLTGSSTILGTLLALRPRERFRRDAALIVDGTLVPTRDHMVAERSKNYRYSTHHQVVINTDTRLVAALGRTLTDDRNDSKA